MFTWDLAYVYMRSGLCLHEIWLMFTWDLAYVYMRSGLWLDFNWFMFIIDLVCLHQSWLMFKWDLVYVYIRSLCKDLAHVQRQEDGETEDRCSSKNLKSCFQWTFLLSLPLRANQTNQFTCISHGPRPVWSKRIDWIGLSWVKVWSSRGQTLGGHVCFNTSTSLSLAYT